MSPWGRTAKRLLDITVSLLMLAGLALPLLICLTLIKLHDGGPVFFRQERIGKDGVAFRVWKFRTMTVVACAEEGPSLLREGDERITGVGEFLRRYGLDELPQVINVLVGEMSLVGPRPTVGYQVEAYNEYEHRRLEMKPGITSLAVVSGRNALSWKKRIELDIQYIDHWSIGLDVRILLKTLWTVLISREGLYGDDGINDPFVPVSEIAEREKTAAIENEADSSQRRGQG
jgi:undecaprenyl phosphate N,N'-diacetylbacillosamine 1-phosphate transferase